MEVILVILYISMGDIKLELDKVKVFIIVENFVIYVNEGYYNGIIFYCVIGNFMI